MRLWVSHVHAGTIIGKGGAHIKAVREQSSCRVMVAEAPQPGSERLVTIIGPAANVQTAVELLVERIHEQDLSLTPTAPDGPSLSHVLKLCVPHGHVGAIIGKGGETIAEVQQKIGAKIKLSKANDFYPGTNERVCLISGSKDAVTGICQFLQEKVKEKPDPHSKPAIDFDNKVSSSGGLYL